MIDIPLKHDTVYLRINKNIQLKIILAAWLVFTIKVQIFVELLCMTQESSMLYLLLNPPFLPLWSPLAASPASLSTDIAVLKFSSLNSP